jgi:histidinol phosphatase-like PHP family hydrolase
VLVSLTESMMRIIELMAATDEDPGLQVSLGTDAHRTCQVSEVQDVD